MGMFDQTDPSDLPDAKPLAEPVPGPLYSVGNVVLLKSGGPAMTVFKPRAAVLGEFLVECEWFAGAELHRDVFDQRELLRTG